MLSYDVVTGSGFGYHTLTICLYQDQLVRRVDPKKRSLAQFFEDEFAKKFCMFH